MRSGHNRAVDWWSLGTLMYDMLTGSASLACAAFGGRVEVTEDAVVVGEGVKEELPISCSHWITDKLTEILTLRSAGC